MFGAGSQMALEAVSADLPPSSGSTASNAPAPRRYAHGSTRNAESRTKIGLDVAVEALRNFRREASGTIDELWHAAEVCRVTNVMRPYMEATVGSAHRSGR